MYLYVLLLHDLFLDPPVAGKPGTAMCAIRVLRSHGVCKDALKDIIIIIIRFVKRQNVKILPWR